MPNHKTPSVCVIGAGVIGLSTAVNITENIPHAVVTVIADKFSPNTTGDVAAGFWYPHAIGDTPIEKVLKWGISTWDHLLTLVISNGKDAGVQMVSGYQVFKSQEPERTYSSIFPRYGNMTQKELSLLGGKYQSGKFFTSVMCQFTIYSAWLMDRFRRKGGTVVKRTLGSLDQIFKEYDVIVNCSGLGANKLVNDTTVQPIKGHVLKVLAPWLKHFTIVGDGDCYIIPGQNYVTLGGTHYAGDWNTQPAKTDSLKIWERCCQVLPSLKDAKIIGEMAGLRPGRPTVRLETEVINYNNGQKKCVVHNYGHGGSGITLHWGCAVEATQLVRDCLGMAKL